MGLTSVAASSGDEEAEHPSTPGGEREEGKQLEPPDFSIPLVTASTEEDGEAGYELVAIRIPAHFDPDDLDGITLDFSVDAGLQIGSLAESSNTGKGGGGYGIVEGDLSESANFRVLISKDDEDNPCLMQAVEKPFSKHLNVVRASSLVELDGETDEPTPDPLVPVRRAYSSVPQQANLKRRFMPAGAANGRSTKRDLNKAQAIIQGLEKGHIAKKPKPCFDPMMEMRDAPSPRKSPPRKRQDTDSDDSDSSDYDKEEEKGVDDEEGSMVRPSLS